MDLSKLERIVVVGTSCAGKTTLARTLSGHLGVPHVELDALYWGPNWTPRPDAAYRSEVAAAMATPAWVADGNDSMLWPRATSLVWLNYSFPRIYSRAIARTLRRMVTREELYAGNRESIRQIVEGDWIPWWVLRTFWRRRRELSRQLREPAAAQLQVFEFTKPQQGEHFLDVCSRLR